MNNDIDFSVNKKDVIVLIAFAVLTALVSFLF